MAAEAAEATAAQRAIAARELARRAELNRWCLAYSRAVAAGNRSLIKRVVRRIWEQQRA